MHLNYYRFFILLIVIATASSCASNKDIAYFKDIQSVNQGALEKAIAYVEPKIQPDDILSVSIFTLNPQTGAIVNQAATTPALGGNSNSASVSQSTGFLVDKNGEIELSLIGKIKVAGLTTFQARELIKDKVSKDYKNPNVQLRFANFKVSVIGEVNAPSTYTFPNEKVSILDALSLAGDLTIYGRRDNILIVRENNGKKEMGRVNLNSSSIFESPYYYLNQNDVIYIEPNKAKASANNAGQIQTLGVITSVATVLLLAISVLK
jgi:polysaccharide export outer membrane protein